MLTSKRTQARDKIIQITVYAVVPSVLITVVIGKTASKKTTIVKIHKNVFRKRAIGWMSTERGASLWSATDLFTKYFQLNPN